MESKFFARRAGRLHCENVLAEDIARAVGTPVYVYSRAAIERNFRRFDAAFRGHPHTICYSVKANPSLGVLRLLARMGAGFDIVSGGELERVLRAGGDARRVVFSGVGKTAAEMDEGLAAGVMLFNVESGAELKLLSERARRAKSQAQVALRVNPDVDAHTHPYISTGLRRHKFGIAFDQAEGLYLKGRDWGLGMAGVTCHIGSQILTIEPFLDALGKILTLAGRLRKQGLDIRFLDLGGGVGIPYRPDEPAPDVAQYARRITAMVRRAAPRGGYHVLLEPGRSIVGEAGVLLSRVLYRKRAGKKNFVILDAAMNDLLRPALYGAHHEIQPAAAVNGRRHVVADIVGPVCESGDFFAHDRRLPDVRSGELVAIFTAGAYAASLGSNYNSRPRPPEVIVDGKRFRIVRRRETYDDLLRLEAAD